MLAQPFARRFGPSWPPWPLRARAGARFGDAWLWPPMPRRARAGRAAPVTLGELAVSRPRHVALSPTSSPCPPPRPQAGAAHGGAATVREPAGGRSIAPGRRGTAWRTWPSATVWPHHGGPPVSQWRWFSTRRQVPCRARRDGPVRKARGHNDARGPRARPAGLGAGTLCLAGGSPFGASGGTSVPFPWGDGESATMWRRLGVTTATVPQSRTTASLPARPSGAGQPPLAPAWGWRPASRKWRLSRAAYGGQAASRHG